MSQLTREVCVVYQEVAQLQDYIRRCCVNSDSPKYLLKFRGDRLDRIIVTWDNPFTGQVCTEVRLCRRINELRDAHNLAGLRFDSYFFLGDNYPVDVLNYLMSRTRR